MAELSACQSTLNVEGHVTAQPSLFVKLQLAFVVISVYNFIKPS